MKANCSMQSLDSITLFKRSNTKARDPEVIPAYRSPRELRRAIAEYIRKYNTIRPHQALDNKTLDDVYYTPFSRSATNTAGLDSAPLAC